MVKLVNSYHFLASEEDFISSFYSKEPTDCILYSIEGFQFRIHKEILSQTKFMHNILSSANGCGCQILEIFCPCSKYELEYMIKFLYQGQIDCSVKLDFVKILKNLKDIFGFPEKFHEECFKDYGVATSKKCFPRETKDNLSSTAKSNMRSKDSIFIQDPNGTQLKMNELFKVDNDQSKITPAHEERKTFKHSLENTSSDKVFRKRKKGSNCINKKISTEEVPVSEGKTLLSDGLSELGPGKKVLTPTVEKHKIWICPNCANEFKSRKVLRDHIASVHKGQKPYKCASCDVSFVHVDSLKKHCVSNHGINAKK